MQFLLKDTKKKKEKSNAMWEIFVCTKTTVPCLRFVMFTRRL
jgi:hypothetical protein